MVMTDLLNEFYTQFMLGITRLQSGLGRVFFLLMLIDFLLIMLFSIGGDRNKLTETLIKKALKYGFFSWLFLNWRWLSDCVIEGFVWCGLRAGGGRITETAFASPSGIVDIGQELCLSIFNRSFAALDNMFNLGKTITFNFAGYVILFSFFIVAVQVFISYLEFALISTCAFVFIPFGTNDHTKFLAEKAIGALIGAGVKLMVLAFICSVSIPIVSTWTMSYDPQFSEIINCVIGSLTIAFLAWQAPSLAQSLMTGTPALDAGGVAATALAAGSAALTAGKGITKGIDTVEKAVSQRIANKKAAAAAASGVVNGVKNATQISSSSGTNFSDKGAGAVNTIQGKK